ncbi:type III-A CRISPR-associated protein Csm2 [Methanosarcinales archaeon]|nr:MAG: type III-A CRISPR-associated protein Csm2 [Methanosarcinales archaeon]
MKQRKERLPGKESHQKLSQEDVVKWVREGPNTELIDKVNEFSEDLKRKNLATSQIRQVFTRLKAIEAKGYSKEIRIEFLMLKPHLAYAAGRHPNIKPLKQIIDYGIDEVVQGDEDGEQPRFKNFCKLFEAILAYHRFHGGR